MRCLPQDASKNVASVSCRWARSNGRLLQQGHPDSVSLTLELSVAVARA